jgi:dsDNA-binding SOS-regulon protein
MRDTMTVRVFAGAVACRLDVEYHQPVNGEEEQLYINKAEITREGQCVDVLDELTEEESKILEDEALKIIHESRKEQGP